MMKNPIYEFVKLCCRLFVKKLFGCVKFNSSVSVANVNNLNLSFSMEQELIIYVDGACRNNGQSNPQGGCGVYWGPLHPMNTSEVLLGKKQTNNCAELSAAIIALVQCKTLGIDTVEIHTDSKYVKDGITKWIKGWKSNNWKLGKGNSDVLNKCLWELLDNIQNQLEVKWKWVEAHMSITGNLRADELAKDGISSGSHYWQDLAGQCMFTDTENNINEKDEDVSNQDIQDTKCGKCQSPVTKSGIQCVSCKKWYDYKCTMLPPYQLYIYETSQRKYTCHKCSGVTARFLNSLDFEVPSVDSQTETDSKDVQCSIPVTTQETQTDAVTFQSPSCVNCDGKEEKEHVNAKQYLESSVSVIQKTFIEAIDKLSSVQNSNSNLVKELTTVRHENEVLRRKMQQADRDSLNQRKCNCLDIQTEMENCVKERDNWRQKFADCAMEKEIEMSKCVTDSKILKQHLDSANNQINVLKLDLQMLEERLKSRNESIIDLENIIQKQRLEIHSLQEDVMSWKMHNSRVDDSLLKVDKVDVIHSSSDSKISKQDEKEVNKNNEVNTTTQKTPSVEKTSKDDEKTQVKSPK